MGAEHFISFRSRVHAVLLILLLTVACTTDRGTSRKAGVHEPVCRSRSHHDPEQNMRADHQTCLKIGGTKSGPYESCMRNYGWSEMRIVQCDPNKLNPLELFQLCDKEAVEASRHGEGEDFDIEACMKRHDPDLESAEFKLY